MPCAFLSSLWGERRCFFLSSLWGEMRCFFLSSLAEGRCGFSSSLLFWGEMRCFIPLSPLWGEMPKAEGGLGRSSPDRAVNRGG